MGKLESMLAELADGGDDTGLGIVTEAISRWGIDSGAPPPQQQQQGDDVQVTLDQQASSTGGGAVAAAGGGATAQTARGEDVDPAAAVAALAGFSLDTVAEEEQEAASGIQLPQPAAP